MVARHMRRTHISFKNKNFIQLHDCHSTIMTAVIKYVSWFAVVVHSLIDRIKWQWNSPSVPFNFHQLVDWACVSLCSHLLISIGELLNKIQYVVHSEMVTFYLGSITLQWLFCKYLLRPIETNEEKTKNCKFMHFIYVSAHCIRWLVYTNDMIYR